MKKKRLNLHDYTILYLAEFKTLDDTLEYGSILWREMIYIFYRYNDIELNKRLTNYNIQVTEEGTNMYFNKLCSKIYDIENFTTYIKSELEKCIIGIKFYKDKNLFYSKMIHDILNDNTIVPKKFKYTSIEKEIGFLNNSLGKQYWRKVV